MKTQGKVLFRNTIRRIAPLLMLPFMAVYAFAQTQGQADITVNSNPNGALVQLQGDVTVSGVAPVRFNQLIMGNYRLKVTMYGYENYSSQIMVDPSKAMNLSVDLKPKTRFKAALRSLVIPGWGQRYFDKRRRGNVFTALAVVSVAGYFWIDHEFQKKYDLYVERLNHYDALRSTGSLSDLRSFQPSLDEAQKDAYDYENIRRGAIGTVIGIWSLNVLDVLFFSTPKRPDYSVKQISVTPGEVQGSPGLSLSWSF